MKVFLIVQIKQTYFSEIFQTAAHGLIIHAEVICNSSDGRKEYSFTAASDSAKKIIDREALAVFEGDAMRRNT